VTDAGTALTMTSCSRLCLPAAFVRSSSLNRARINAN